MLTPSPGDDPESGSLRRRGLGADRPESDFDIVRNLTPHAITLVGTGRSVTLQPAGPPARLILAPDQPDGTVILDHLPVPLFRTFATSTVENLPDRSPGVLLIVARPVAEELPDRDDLAYPHKAVRNDSGVVIGCRAFGRPGRTSRTHAGSIPSPSIEAVNPDKTGGG